MFCSEDKTFYFGTLIPSKLPPEGVSEKIKIINNGKVHATVKFDVRKKTSSSNELFAFEINPKTAKIPPHESKYVYLTFKPQIMAQYSGIFEAIVENAEQNVRHGKLVFDVRGEGAMPTLKIDRPKEWVDERTLLLKFPRIRLGKQHTESVVVKNDGVIPATAKFDVVPSRDFTLASQSTYTLTPKTFQSFQIDFRPIEVGSFKWELGCNTLLNPYENTKIQVTGECYFENISFEGFPEQYEDEVHFGDCVSKIPKRITFYMKNNTDETIRFNWNLGTIEELSIKPRQGHIQAKGTKAIHLTLKGDKTNTLTSQVVNCETKKVTQGSDKFLEWDDSRLRRRQVTATEYNWIMDCRKAEETFRLEEAEMIKKGKKMTKKKEDSVPAKPAIPAHEKDDVEMEEPIPEPSHVIIASTEKAIPIKIFAKIDGVKYECETKEIVFRETMMYTARCFSFKLKNTSIINMNYSWKFMNPDNGALDMGFYSITPKAGSIRPETEENFEVKFLPTEVDERMDRVLECVICNLDETLEPLQIVLDAEADRPFCHFELPFSNFLQSKGSEMAASFNTSDVKVIEFESLGVKVRNTKRFYVVNPTATGYDFEWKKMDADKLNNTTDFSGFFKCVTNKGVILSGKKYEMVFEYTPELTGTHESLWLFEIPAFKERQLFLIVGKVLEPKVFFEVGRISYGPLLIGGKNKEIVKLKNLDHLPYHYNFNKQSIKGDNEYGDSLSVYPMSGVVNGESEVKLEVTFKPKVEIDYNYNLLCNVTQKPRPLT